MRWAALEQPFVRPVHWLVCLFGGELMPVRFAGVDAGSASRGHRFLCSTEVALDGSVASYERELRKAFVVADPQARMTMIEAELRRIEGETGQLVRSDPELIAEVANLVEYPVGVHGEFAVEYLEVPDEVLVSAMRSHQRYFAMEDDKGALTNRFVTIAGTVTRSPDVVKRGNERVLAARLADAMFFFREDKAVPLAEWATKLDEVVFQKKLGTIGAKVKRVAMLAESLATELGLDAGASSRAALLCKADLVTHMVGEFPGSPGGDGWSLRPARRGTRGGVRRDCRALHAARRRR